MDTPIKVNNKFGGEKMKIEEEKIEWVKLFKREPELLIVFQAPIGRKYYPEAIGISFQPRNLKHEEWVYYIDKKDLIQEFLAIKKEHEKNPLFLVDLADKIEREGEKLVRKTKELKKHIKDKSNKELRDAFEEFNDIFCRYMPFVWVGFSVEKVLAEDIKPKLRAAYPNVSDKEIEEYFNILTSPLFKESTAVMEYKKILEVATLLKEKGKMTPSVEDKIRGLWREFSWAGATRVGWSYQKPPYDVNHYERLINALAQGDPNKQLEQLKQKEKELTKKYNEFIAEKQISPEIIKKADLLQRYIFLRTYRGEVVVQAMVHANPLLSEIGSRFDLKLDDIVYFIPDEIIKLLDSGNIPEYKQRKKGYKLLILDGKPELIGGVKVAETKFEDISELKGQGIVGGIIEGRTRVIYKREDAKKFRDGEVLVTQMTSPDMMPVIMSASAIITDEGGLTCHAALISRELQIPCIIGTEVATKVFKDGDLVEVNSNEGIVRRVKP